MLKNTPIVSWFIIGVGGLILVIVLAAMFTPIRGKIESSDITVGNRPGKGWVNTPWIDVAVQPSKGEIKGLIVNQVGSMAHDAGIKKGDIIRKVNQIETTSTASFQKAIDRADPSNGILLDIFRDGRPYFITVGGQEQENRGLWGNQANAIASNLVPLPVGAARSIIPPHPERGRCHNCHPFSGSQAGQAADGLGLGRGLWCNRLAQQAAGSPTPLPVGAGRTITPPHTERGRCHNCHPFSGSQGGQTADRFGLGLGQENRGLWNNQISQQAAGNPPPLPLGAARTMTPPHAPRGRCHSCHPFSGSAGSQFPIGPGPGGGLGLGRW